MKFTSPALMGLVLAAAAMTALAGCASRNPLVLTRTSCPAVALVKYANSITGFRGAGMDQGDVDYSGQISGIAVTCSSGRGAEAATSNVSFDVSAQRAAARSAGSITLPYFVVVVQDGTTILSKATYTATLQFSDTAGRAVSRQTIVASTPGVPLPPVPNKRRNSDVLDEADSTPKAAKYEILIGFQLRDEQALFNIAR